MPIGSYDTYAELHRVVTGRNDLNEPEESLQLVEPFWCSMRMATGAEQVQDNSQKSAVKYRLKTHFLPNIDETMVVIIDGRSLNILATDSPFRSHTVIDAEYSSDGRRV